MNKNMAPKLPNLLCFQAFGIIFCPDACSYFCLVCGGRGSLAFLMDQAVGFKPPLLGTPVADLLSILHTSDFLAFPGAPPRLPWQSSYLAYSPQNSCEFFLQLCSGNLALKNGGRNLWVDFQWSPFPWKQSTNNPKIFGENSEHNVAQNSGSEIRRTHQL